MIDNDIIMTLFKTVAQKTNEGLGLKLDLETDTGLMEAYNHLCQTIDRNTHLKNRVLQLSDAKQRQAKEIKYLKKKIKTLT